MSTEEAIIPEPASVAITTRPDYDHFAPSDQPQSWFHDEWEIRREECPVSYSPNYGGFYFFTRYEDVYELLTDPETYRSVGAGAVPSSPWPLIPTDVNPPQHRKYRNLVNQALSPQRLAEHEPWMREMAIEILDRLDGRQEFDVVREFADVFPRRVAVRLIGIPEEDLPRVTEWTEILAYSPNHEGNEVAGEKLFGYVGALIADRVKQPMRDDLVSLILSGEVDGQPLPLEEATSYISLLLLGGLMTTTHAIAGTLVWLAEHPEQRRSLTDDLSQLPVAIEEALRYTSPASHVARTTTKDVVLGGCPIPAGSRVMAGLGAANFDRHRFDQPRTMLFDRPRNAHAGFGFGPHRCIGSHLAKLEMRIGLEEFLRRYPEFELPDPSSLRYEGAEVRGLVTARIAILPEA